MRFFLARLLLFVFLTTPAASALAADLEFTADTTLSLSSVTFTTLTVASGSKATSLTVGTSTFTVTVASGDTFTVNASSDITFSNDGGVSTTCGATSSIAIAGPKTSLIVTPTNSACPVARSSDVTPPPAPTSVKGSATSTGVTITWVDPVASDLSMIVIHRNNGGATPLTGEFYATVEKGVQTYTDRTVKLGETYQYLVRARDGTGNLDLNETNTVVATVPFPSSQQEVKTPKTEEKKVEEKQKEAPTPRPEAPAVGVPTESVGKEKKVEERPKTLIRIEERKDGVLTEDTKSVVTAKSTASIAEAAGKVAEPAREEALREEPKIAAVIENAKGTAEVAAVGFIVYGTTTTEKLGEGERAGTLNSYKAAYGRLPVAETEWEDALRIAGGALPEKANLAAEQRAIAVFKRIYNRAPDIDYGDGKSLLTAEEGNDRTALLFAAYGIRPPTRDINAERETIGSFIEIFGKKPVSAAEWDAVRMMAYAAPP